jgi:hypothetical protein
VIGNDTLGTLEVLFKNNEVYHYRNVPKELYESMLGFESVGSFFATYIKGKYPTEKVVLKTVASDATKDDAEKWSVVVTANGDKDSSISNGKDTVTFEFECGCWAKYWAEGNRLQGGLSCCANHEIAYQKIENIVPLTLVKVTY